jgi:hypothetical protein
MILTFDQLLVASKNSLGPDEWWVIDHDEGPLWDTKSKWITVPVRILCEALKCDWDDARESGFRLGKLQLPVEHVAS